MHTWLEGALQKKFPRDPSSQRFGKRGGFLAKLSSSASELLYVVGGLNAFVNDVDIDNQGNAVAVGSTIVNNFPAAASGFQPVLARSEDALVFKVDTGASFATSLSLGEPQTIGRFHLSVRKDHMLNASVHFFVEPAMVYITGD